MGSLLFLIYVNDIPDLGSSTAKMFADDTKVYRGIQKQEDFNLPQEDLTCNSLASWSARWLLKFSGSKCDVWSSRYEKA